MFPVAISDSVISLICHSFLVLSRCKERNEASYKDGSSIYQSLWVTENIPSLNEAR